MYMAWWMEWQYLADGNVRAPNADFCYWLIFAKEIFGRLTYVQSALILFTS